MTHLTVQEKNKLREEIKTVEAQTDGEIVTVITEACEEYYFVFSLWAAVIALFTPWVCSLVNSFISLQQLMLIQTLVFCSFWLLFYWTPIRYFLVPKYLKHRRARRMAHELFFMEKLHHKEQRNAVMLFVAVKERYVEILADADIDKKVDASVWKSIVDAFVGHVKAKRIAQGYEAAINQCGELLIEHFPLSEKNIDELPNHLIEW